MPTLSDYIEPGLWGGDHWSTLAYLETVMVECGGFEIGRDGRMRSNRRNFRVMAEQAPHPKRPGRPGKSVVMTNDQSTRLKNGSVVIGHDDWACVQDMAEAGLFDVPTDAVQPGAMIHLSVKGQALCNRLRAHKADGKRFSEFSFFPEEEM